MFRMSILATILTTGLAHANEPPPEPEGGLVVTYASPCFDRETGEQGMCYLLRDIHGGTYTAFWQGETLQFIRRPLPEGGYETVWINDMYNSY